MNNPIPLITVPDDSPQSMAFARTTHLAIGAHPDDVEIIGIQGIQQCYVEDGHWFTGVVVTNGARSARGGGFSAVENEGMISIRQQEQISAACLGRYSAMIQLGYESTQLLGSICLPLVEVLQSILTEIRPQVLYLHNPADRHATHVSVCLHAVEALRRMPEVHLPEQIWGVEVWRGLDWVDPAQITILDVSGSSELQSKLLASHQSQLQDGKRYDLAVRGRNVANATFASSTSVDELESAIYALDLRPLVGADAISVADYIRQLASQLQSELLKNLQPYVAKD